MGIVPAGTKGTGVVAGRTRELDDTRRLEQGMVAVRWFGVAFGLFQVWQSANVSPKPPPDVTARGYVLALTLFVGNIIITTLVPRARRESQLAAIGFAAFCLDTVVVLGFIWDYS